MQNFMKTIISAIKTWTADKIAGIGGEVDRVNDNIASLRTTADKAQATADKAQATADKAQATADIAQATADNMRPIVDKMPLVVRLYIDSNDYQYATHTPKEIKAAIDSSRMVVIYDEFSMYFPIRYTSSETYIGQVYCVDSSVTVESGRISSNRRVYLNSV